MKDKLQKEKDKKKEHDKEADALDETDNKHQMYEYSSSFITVQVYQYNLKLKR